MSRARAHSDSASVCEVCGKQETRVPPGKVLAVRRRDDYPLAGMLTTGLASSNPQSPLWGFNFRCVHPEHVLLWQLLDDYVAAIEEGTRRGEWQRTPWQRKS